MNPSVCFALNLLGQQTVILQGGISSSFLISNASQLDRHWSLKSSSRRNSSTKEMCLEERGRAIGNLGIKGQLLPNAMAWDEGSPRRAVEVQNEPRDFHVHP